MPPVFAHGAMRLYLLYLLEDRHKHGYEIIRALTDRFGGTYSPSAGSVYPRLSKLEEEGLVSTRQDGRRTLYRLTDAGRRELEERRGELLDIDADISASVTRLAETLSSEIRDNMRSLRADLAATAERFTAARRPGRGAPAEPTRPAADPAVDPAVDPATPAPAAAASPAEPAPPVPMGPAVPPVPTEPAAPPQPEAHGTKESAGTVWSAVAPDAQGASTAAGNQHEPGDRNEVLVGSRVPGGAGNGSARPTTRPATAHPGTSLRSLRELEHQLDDFRVQLRAELRTGAGRHGVDDAAYATIRAVLEQAKASIRSVLR